MLEFSDRAIDIPVSKKIFVLRVNSGTTSPYIKNHECEYIWDYNAKSVTDDSSLGIYGIRADYLSLGFDFHLRTIFASMPIGEKPIFILMEVHCDDVIERTKLTEISFRRANIVQVLTLENFRLFSLFLPELAYIPQLFKDCEPLRWIYKREDYTNWVNGMRRMLDGMFEKLSKQFPKEYIEKVRIKYAEDTKNADVAMRLQKMLSEIYLHHNKQAKKE